MNDAHVLKLLSPEGVRDTAEKNIEEACAVNITKIRSDRSRPINRSSLPELFFSFLTKVLKYLLFYKSIFVKTFYDNILKITIMNCLFFVR